MAWTAPSVVRCISSPWMVICSIDRFMRSQPSTAFMSLIRLSSSSTSRVGVTMPGSDIPMPLHMLRTKASGSIGFGVSAGMSVSLAWVFGHLKPLLWRK